MCGVSSGGGQDVLFAGIVDGIQQVLGVHGEHVGRLEHALTVLAVEQGGAVLLGQPHGRDEGGHVSAQHLVGHLNLQVDTSIRPLPGIQLT